MLCLHSNEHFMEKYDWLVLRVTVMHITLGEPIEAIEIARE